MYVYMRGGVVQIYTALLGGGGVTINISHLSRSQSFSESIYRSYNCVKNVVVQVGFCKNVCGGGGLPS